jgi:hypothetical protein
VTERDISSLSGVWWGAPLFVGADVTTRDDERDSSFFRFVSSCSDIQRSAGDRQEIANLV